MNTRVKEITDLVSLRTLQKIQDSFSIALGIPLSIRNLEGELLTKISNESKLWSIVKTHPDSDGTIRSILKEAFQKCLRTGQIVIFERYIHTKAFAVPININGKIIAFFVGGLVRLENPDLRIAQIEAKKLNIDVDEYLEAFLELFLFSPERLEAVANLIKIISNTISSLEFQENEIRLKTERITKEKLELSKTLEKTSLALDNSEARFEQLFQSISDGIYMADMNGKMVEINPAGARMFGFEKPEQLKGQLIKNYYVYPEDRERFVNTLLSKGHIEHFVALIRTKTGQHRYYETNAILVKDKHGAPMSIQGIFRDINDRMDQKSPKS